MRKDVTTMELMLGFLLGAFALGPLPSLVGRFINNKGEKPRDTKE